MRTLAEGKVIECLKSYRSSQIGQAAAIAQEMMRNDPVLHLLVGETVSDRTACGLNPSCWHFIEGGKKKSITSWAPSI